MMRQRLLAVRGEVFDVAGVRREIEEVAALFGEYLAQTTTGRGSKHRALGAVGKALQHARTVRGDALLGYARRVHEQITGTSYPAGAVEKLDEGIRKLDALLARDDVPARAAAEILSRIDYATYFDVRRRGVEFLRGWDAVARQHMEMLGSRDVNRPAFGKARKGEMGTEWKDLAEQYLQQSRLAAIAEDEEEE